LRKHERLRAFNKRFFNPLMLKLAGKKYVPFAVVRHVGRRSGKTFETPIIAKPVRGGFVIALTYGSDVDWYRNVMSAGGAIMRWQGKEHAVGKPEPLASKVAMPLFPLPLRLILRLNHTEEFVLVRNKPARNAQNAQPS
jgi:deazaflavin-dependent oxidoreductase (nitroreductase family)